MTTIATAIDATNIPSETVVIKQKELYSTRTYEEKDTDSQEEEQGNQAQIESDSGDSFDVEEESNYRKTNELSEAALINSDFFETELLSAFENIKEIAKIDRQRILTCVVSEYVKSAGAEPSPQMVSDALQTFDFGIITENDSESESDTELEKAELLDEISDSQNEIESESEIEEKIEIINPDLFESEFAEALENVRSLGRAHQEIFVNNICDTFVELNGSEATVNDLTAVFGRMRATFSEEAREAFVEENELSSEEESEASEDSDSDSDFEPNEAEDKLVIESDELIDVEEEDEVNELDEDYVPENDTFGYRYAQDVQDSEEFESDESESESAEIEEENI